MSEDTTDWTELREFRGVDLTGSFALSWSLESGSLLIDVDMLLLPQHAFYEKPRPAEKDCYRPVFVEFAHCEAVTFDGDDGDDGAQPAEQVKNIAAGRIAGLRRIGEGVYEIGGDFGTVRITAERPMLRMKNNRA